MPHTPGPWHIHRSEGMPPSIHGHNEEIVCYLRGDGRPHEQGEANARLLAAAPTLLAQHRAALESIRAVLIDGLIDHGSRTNLQKLFEAVETTITKATGDA